jgi:hypothetical protein
MISIIAVTVHAGQQIQSFNPSNTELNPICHMLALLGAHHIFHVSGLRVKLGHFSYTDAAILTQYQVM